MFPPRTPLFIADCGQAWEGRPLCRPIFPVLVNGHLIRRTAQMPSLPDKKTERPRIAERHIAQVVERALARRARRRVPQSAIRDPKSEIP
jgi:hypothetical protein